MKLTNPTPGQSLVFRNQDEEGDSFHVFVLKSAFKLGLDGQLIENQNSPALLRKRRVKPTCTSAFGAGRREGEPKPR